jgi:hypothetical protein
VGEKHWKAFLKDRALHVDKLLRLVHTNVWGLGKTASLGGARYFVFFIDYFFLKSFIYILKSKSRVFFKVQRFTSLHRKPDLRKN